MKLGVLKKVTVEDITRAKDVDAKFKVLIEVLNPFIDAMVAAVFGRISFSDNIQCKILTNEYESGTAQAINIGTTLKPIGVIPVSALNKTITGFSWSRLQSNQISVTFTFSGGGSTDCSILVITE